MAGIIKMDSKKFLNKFLGNYDMNDFEFILISEDVVTKNNFKNVMTLSSLMPTKAELDFRFDIGEDAFVKKYVERLNSKDNKICIGSILKAVTDHNFNIVLLCSPREMEIGYMDILCNYISDIFEIDVLSLKDIKKDKSILKSEVSDKENIQHAVSKFMGKINNETKPIDKLDDSERIKSIITSIPNSIGMQPIKKLLKENNFSKADIKEMSKTKMVKKAYKLCNKDKDNLNYLLREVEKFTKKKAKKQ